MNSSPDPSLDPALAKQRLAAVAAVAAHITHSGRNRLAVVRAALELLQARMEDELSDEQRASFLHQLDLFLGDFNLGVDLIRCHEGGRERVSAREAAAEAVEAMRGPAEAAGVGLRLALDAEQDEITADRSLLRTVLLNLIRNAMEALPGTPDPRICVRTAAEGKRLRILVEDNGPGISPAVHDRLFREWVTERRGAAGIGLVLCRDAMAVMGGSIAYLTPRGQRGAVFRLEFAP